MPGFILLTDSISWLALPKLVIAVIFHLHSRTLEMWVFFSARSSDASEAAACRARRMQNKCYLLLRTYTNTPARSSPGKRPLSNETSPGPMFNVPPLNVTWISLRYVWSIYLLPRLCKAEQSLPAGGFLQLQISMAITHFLLLYSCPFWFCGICFAAYLEGAGYEI